jgi:glutathione S-transferase
MKLTYFPMAGRAEASRLALAVGGIAFDDVRIPFPEFMEMKPNLPYGQLPVLELDDGVTVGESKAILRYCGKLSGIYPSDPVTALKVDEIVDACSGVSNLLTPSFKEKDEEKKKAMRIELVETAFPDILSKIDKRLELFGGSAGWAVGDSLTIADIEVMVFCRMFKPLDHVPDDIALSYKRLKEVHDKCASHPKIAAYYEAQK